MLITMFIDTHNIRIEDFDYPLPDHRIARHPLADRASCLLLCRQGNVTSTHRFSELPSLLPADSLLVCNNTRVINARLRMRKPTPGGAAIEVFCLEPAKPEDYAVNFASTGPVEWTCFVGNSKRWKEGELTMLLPGTSTTLRAVRTNRSGNTSTVRFEWDDPGLTFAEVIALAGVIPVPPYLNRDTEESDKADYQTVYSRIDGSVAAPTAGLHFTTEVLDAISKAGIPKRELTLHVGAGTFQPVKTDTIGEHEMHSEFISVEASLIADLAHTGRRIVAVGTTSVRTLESLYHMGCMASQGIFAGELPQWYPYAPTHPRLTVAEALEALLRHMDGAPRLLASTRLMIAPGYDYRIVRGMVTNFHQPRSTLLLLVSAFLGGGELWRELYDYALTDLRYRFLSYGDACLLLP